MSSVGEGTDTHLVRIRSVRAQEGNYFFPRHRLHGCSINVGLFSKSNEFHAFVATPIA